MNKKITALLLALMLISMSVTCPVKVRADDTLTGCTSSEITAMMGKGWNLGNTFDATGGNSRDIYSQEQSWGNAKVTKELIEGVAAAGFTTIRIPITWYKHISNDGSYTVDSAWLDRIKEVVDWSYESGLFVIINAHHENWINKASLADDYIETGEELYALWSQIADYFADYDQHLIFEGMNEPRAADTSYEWTGTAREYEAVNYLDQKFVDAVRDNGRGYNSERALMVPAYAASSSRDILSALVLPTRDGQTASNLIVSMHCYNPYNFCLSDAQATFNPSSSSDTSGIISVLQAARSLFLDQGMPVVLGECGCTNTGNNTDARIAWLDYFGRKSAEYGIPAILWDNGNNGTSGGECHSYIVRSSGQTVDSSLTDAFIYGYEEDTSAKDRVISFEPVKSGSETILSNPQSEGFLPTGLTNRAGVNHTADVSGMGFSLKADSAVCAGRVTLDISEYTGLSLVIGAYVCSDGNEHIAVGISTGSGDTEYASADTGSGWQPLSFRYTVGEGETGLYFSGEADSTYYIDDISILIDDGSLPADPAALFPADEISDTASDSSNTADDSGVSASDEVSDSGISDPDSSDSASSDSDSSGSDSSGSGSSDAVSGSGSPAVSQIFIIAGIILIAAGLLIVCIARSKNKSRK